MQISLEKDQNFTSKNRNKFMPIHPYDLEIETPEPPKKGCCAFIVCVLIIVGVLVGAKYLM